MNLPRRISIVLSSCLLIPCAFSQVGPTPPAATTRTAAHVVSDPKEKAQQAENDAIWAALDRPIELFEVNEVPLASAIEKLMGMTTVRNWRALWQDLLDAGVARDKPISLKLREVPARRVLQALLSEAGGPDVRLGFEVIAGILEISTTASLGSHLNLRVYPIGDILVRDISRMQARVESNRPADEPTSFEADAVERAEAQFRAAMERQKSAAANTEESSNDQEPPRNKTVWRTERLLDLIRQSIAPDTWLENGGIGTVQAFDDCLVVRNNMTVQREIAQFLNDLRAGIIESRRLRQEAMRTSP